ncbi:hypothetical protein QEH42_gp205 [Microbacterium phage Pumpernickel]|uniref:Uncharacterized protein n=1 Tax=Microbacterium phage Pumpernickel TaxID=2885983 RepID=A0AAE8Y7S4_9CAUD|nr:hypothetical protein QEH42_gp205 [Microbacterium phage Pumpernickel]UDL16013.1 hypothetical protein SEA_PUMPERNICKEL_263 [Microbacterium phage Pumpernickel]
MKDFVAKTENGAIWTYKDGFLKIESSRGPMYNQAFYARRFKSVNIAKALAEGGGDMTLHQYLTGVPETDEVIVGDRLYAAGIDEWRLSTLIVEVEYLD